VKILGAILQINIDLHDSVVDGDDQGSCCLDPQIYTDSRGYLICKNCGTSHGVEFSDSERRAYNESEYRNRRRTACATRNFGARTYFNINLGDAKGKKLSQQVKLEFWRLTRYNTSLISSLERNFWEARPFLQKICSCLGIPLSVEQTAWLIYTEAARQKLTMGRSIQGFICASLHIAARISKIPRNYEDICVFATENITQKLLNKTLFLLIHNVLPVMQKRYGMNYSYLPVDIQEILRNFGNDLGLKMETIMFAKKLLQDLKEANYVFAGRDPKGIAGSLLYIASSYFSKRNGEKKINQREIASVSKVTEVTIRSRIKEIKRYLILDFEDD